MEFIGGYKEEDPTTHQGMCPSQVRTDSRTQS